MDAFLITQWLLFGAFALVWMTFCGANLLLLLSDRSRSYLPFVGATAGALAGLVLPESMELSSRLCLAAVLFAVDPFWLGTPLSDARAWLQRR